MLDETLPEWIADLEKARNTQRQLFPRLLPLNTGYELFASYQTARILGSDYFDVIGLGENKICIACGEVCSVGISGALQMAWLGGCVQGTMETLQEVQPTMIALNKHVCGRFADGCFATLVLMIVDLRTHKMTMANAGHLPPLIRKANGTLDRIPEDACGLPLGVLSEFSCNIVTRDLEPGDMVIAFTDEFVDTMSPSRELYTISRMMDVIEGCHQNPGQLGQALLADNQKHAQGSPRRDDMVLIVLGRSRQ